MRFRAAAGVFARIGERVERTLALVRLLDEEGLITLDPSVYTQDVVAGDPNFSWKLTAGYSAPLDAPLPEDLTQPDPSVWKAIAEDVELRGDDATTQ